MRSEVGCRPRFASAAMEITPASLLVPPPPSSTCLSSKLVCDGPRTGEGRSVTEMRGGDVVDAVLLVLIVVAGGNTRVEKEEGSEKRGHTEVGNNVVEIVVGQLHF